MLYQLSYLVPPQGQVVGLKRSCPDCASPMLGESLGTWGGARTPD